MPRPHHSSRGGCTANVRDERTQSEFSCLLLSPSTNLVKQQQATDLPLPPVPSPIQRGPGQVVCSPSFSIYSPIPNDTNAIFQPCAACGVAKRLPPMSAQPPSSGTEGSHRSPPHTLSARPISISTYCLVNPTIPPASNAGKLPSQVAVVAAGDYYAVLNALYGIVKTQDT
jgi:hypothetical protein